ncbi:MAG: RraA family protein, partial [Candidatus Limnocylindria bacterium]
MTTEDLEFDAIAKDLHSAVVSDVLDAIGHRDHALPEAIRPFDHGSRLVGRAMTMQLVPAFSEPEQPYEGFISAMDRIPAGSVVVLVARETRCALWGELFSTAARARGARGTLVDGYVRDTEKVRAMGYPVFARGVSPLDSRGRAAFLVDGVTVKIDGISVTNGDLVVGDYDGIVIVPQAVAVEVIRRAYEKVATESIARSALGRG